MTMKRVSKIEKAIFEMLTENTGIHNLDSGGAFGRNWQRNQSLTIEDFRKRPEATVELSMWRDGEIEAIPTVDLFHYLSQTLELDDLCKKFNSHVVNDWESEEFYGVSQRGEQWILKRFETEGESFNSYNWESTLSQGVQGRHVVHEETGKRYVVLQIHGGCDVRGGYTNAKLFKLSVDGHYFLSGDCCFEDFDYMGEWIAPAWMSMTDEAWTKIAEKHKVTKDHSVTLEGSILLGG
jgi:hypothetical protein